ncbi:MAG TPA: TadE family protein, partial [Chloroflexota bacterium]|nr:TadE family protein [Chloroflexota bacterium]
MIRKKQRGQALVEMALVFPVFILLVMGILDLGRAVWQANTMAEAARQGARYAITAPSDCTGI